MSDGVSTGSLDRFSASKGLNIQFARSSPTLLSPKRVSENTFPSESTSHGTPTQSIRDPSSPTMSSGIIVDLMQIQQELALLARTENMRLSGADMASHSRQSGVHRRNTSNDGSYDLDEDTTLYEDESTYPAGALNRKKFFGSEYDLRNAVVERLAELREQRMKEKLTSAETIQGALCNLITDLCVLFKLLAKKRPSLLGTFLTLLILFVAHIYHMHTVNSMGAKPIAESIVMATSHNTNFSEN